MKMALGLLAAALLWGPPALAQESHRFDAKALKAKYDLPVYSARGKVVDDDIVESSNDFIHEQSGIYGLRTPLKKVLAYYTKALGAPKQDVTDTGAKKWVFKAADPPDSLTRHRVYVHYDKVAHVVQVTLWMRTYDSRADVDN